MFDAIYADVTAAAEQPNPSTDQTIATLLANLYGDTSDAAFIARCPVLVSVSDLTEAMCHALARGDTDTYHAYLFEVLRFHDGPLSEISYAIHGNRAGLSRVH